MLTQQLKQAINTINLVICLFATGPNSQSTATNMQIVTNSKLPEYS